MKFLRTLLFILLFFATLTLTGGCENRNPNDDEIKKEEEFDYDIPESGQIPVVRIVTNTGLDITDKETYVNATLTVEDPDLLFGSEVNVSYATEIRGRGNSTWGMPKKPYKMKLNKKARLLGMSENKHWVLLANYSDKTLLRNAAAFEISKIVGMDWTPLWRPVEVYLNGEYQGLYMLTEHVRVDSERVEMETAGLSGDGLNGGYFVEIDERLGELHHFTLDWKLEKDKSLPQLPVCFVEPEIPTDDQKNYLRNYFQKAQDVLYDPGFADPVKGYAAYLDVDSFIRYFIVEEITKDVDGDMRLSTFMWKPRDGKLGFPCVWDFDITLGNCDYIEKSPYYWHIRNCIWFGQLFKDPAFVARTKEMWREIYPQLPRVEGAIRKWAALSADARKRNFQKWPILGVHVWPNVDAEKRKTYEAELEYMLDYFNRRIVWMNNGIEEGRLLRN